MPNPLTAAVRNLSSVVAVIDIRGDITAQAEAVLMEAYQEAGHEGAQTILLNFTGLDYMNSSGIGVLVMMLIRVQRQKQRLAAYGLSDHYRQIFDLTRLSEAIAIYPDEATATAGIR